MIIHYRMQLRMNKIYVKINILYEFEDIYFDNLRIYYTSFVIEYMANEMYSIQNINII